MNPDIQWALGEFVGSRRVARYHLLEKYYLGDHNLNFATDKFRNVFGQMLKALSDNLCESVVETIAERLQVIGFSSDQATVTQEILEIDQAILDKLNVVPPAEFDPLGQAEEGTGAPPQPFQPPVLTKRNDPLAAAAWDLWEENYMDVCADEVHREMLTKGDGFAIVWPDGNGDTTIWPQCAENMAVRYSSVFRNTIEVGAKFWLVPDPDDPTKGNKARLTLYYPDHIERYITKTRIKQMSALKPSSFVPFEGDDGGPQQTHDYKRNPVFHWPNKRWGCYGISELNNVVPLQDALNKAICDMLVAMEFSAFRQRWVTGIEVDVDEDTGKPKDLPFNYGSDRMISSADPDAKFGDFSQTDMEQFLKVQRDFRAEVARVTGIPLHYMFVTTAGDTPSGEALKTSELRFAKKLKKQQDRSGKQWEEVVQFAIRVEGEPKLPSSGHCDFNTLWETASPRSESEQMDTLIKKQSIDVPNSQLQREAGYDDDQIEQFAVEMALHKAVNVANTTTPAVPEPAPEAGAGNPGSSPKKPSPRQTRDTPAQRLKDKAVPPQNQ